MCLIVLSSHHVLKFDVMVVVIVFRCGCHLLAIFYHLLWTINIKADVLNLISFNLWLMLVIVAAKACALVYCLTLDFMVLWLLYIDNLLPFILKFIYLIIDFAQPSFYNICWRWRIITRSALYAGHTSSQGLVRWYKLIYEIIF